MVTRADLDRQSKAKQTSTSGINHFSALASMSPSSGSASGDSDSLVTTAKPAEPLVNQAGPASFATAAASLVGDVDRMSLNNPASSTAAAIAEDSASDWRQAIRKTGSSGRSSAAWRDASSTNNSGASGDGMFRGSSSRLMGRVQQPSSSSQPSSTHQPTLIKNPSSLANRPQAGNYQGAPKGAAIGGPRQYGQSLPMNPQSTVELHDFSAELKTEDLHAFVQRLVPALVSSPQASANYRLKWQDDTSCFVVCATVELANDLLAAAHVSSSDSSPILVRPFSQENCHLHPKQPQKASTSADAESSN